MMTTSGIEDLRNEMAIARGKDRHLTGYVRPNTRP